MTSRIVLARIVLALAVALALAASLGPVRAASADGVKDPHGKADGCVSCHVGAAGGALRPESESCLTCHPAGDPHPANQLPKKVHVPAGWPLLDGRVTCATCHADPSCGPGRAAEAPYLRGGNVTRSITFCDRCHNDGTLGRVDPHHPRHAGDNADPTCAACHSGIPEKGALPEASRLRLEPDEACQTCHVGEIHVGTTAHLGKTVAPSVPTDLPLTSGRAIACWTCHDVHGGVVTSDTIHRRAAAEGIHALAIRPPAAATATITPVVRGATPPPATTGIQHPPMLALPVSDGALCRSCHGDGPS